MPFSGPSSYLETIDEFIGHWTDVDFALGLDPLVLSGGYTLAMLQTDRGSLATGITQVEGVINLMEGFRTNRFIREPAIRERLRQLGAFVKGVLASSVYTGQVPPLIPDTANPGKWIVAMDDASHMWTTINASPPAGFTPPLVLTGSYTLAMFNTDIAALKAVYTSMTQAEQDVDRELEERDTVFRAIKDHLVQYRVAVAGRFAEDHPLVLSIPRLTPLPGHTPDPVVLSGVWNGGTLKADLSWTASADPDLDHYAVRRSGSDPYNTNTEVAVDTVAAGTLVLSTDEGLTAPGTMRYKVYVVLTTSNEKGSNAVEVVRP